MPSTQYQQALKPLLLLGMGFFLFSRIANGTLYFYISERFAWLTGLAFAGFLLVGLSYRWGQRVEEHDHDHPHDPHHEHNHHGHNHTFGWGGMVLVALPILLGILVPPQPLGASALSTREMSVGSLDSVMPGAVRGAEEKSAAERNILDWVMAFRSAQESGERFDGIEADVIGFVYRQEDQAAQSFWAARFVVGCCVADATPAGILVRWPHSSELADETWVRITGRFAEESGQPAPVLIAQTIEEVPIPNQPYLYP